ncbi:MAG TPA: 2-nitropropane dioxygenase [Thermoanaerobaculia bacterium]|nr:2-nitropropane dioxygenase [Thermoanaerobaculia bacterium]
MANLEVICPGCDATLVVDSVSGEVLLKKLKPTQPKSFESIISQLATEKSEAAKRFDQGIESQKDRSRILDERFKEALDRADKSDTPFRNPMDYD